MFRLEKEFRFEASHQLPCHDGKCARLHGHSWRGRIVCEGPNLLTDGPKTGMLMDYSDMKKALEPYIEEFLDHHHLNETLWPFKIHTPTSEEIARWLFNQLRPVLPLLVAVRIEETCTSACTYSPRCIKGDDPL